MARVISLSQLAPEDVVIDLGNGTRYTIPGATPATTMIELSRLHADIGAVQLEIEGIPEGTPEPDSLHERQHELILDLDAHILGLLQIRQPELVSTGLSAEQLGWFLGAIITGFREQAGEDPPPQPSRATRRAARPAASRSKRSSGSPDS